MVKVLAFDTETTGLDIKHGALPFLVTTCDDTGFVRTWEWHVDPLTRLPEVPRWDLIEIQKLLDSADLLVAHNAKFDVSALNALWEHEFQGTTRLDWRWDRLHDTMMSCHLLASNRKNNLTDRAMEHLGLDIEPYEKTTHEHVEKARRLSRRKGFGMENWRIAKRDLEEMPSAKDKTWKSDLWLPRAICREADARRKVFLKLKGEKWTPPRFWTEAGVRKARGEEPKPWWWEYADPNHPWRTSTRLYADADSQTTVLLFDALSSEIRDRKLEKIYEWRRKLIRVNFGMEDRGVSVIAANLDYVEKEFDSFAQEAANECRSIARKLKYDLELPKTGNNRSLIEFCFGKDLYDEETGEHVGRKNWLRLPVLKRSEKTGVPSFDKGVVEKYLTTLEEGSPQYRFVDALAGKRKRDTALTFIRSYRRFWRLLRRGYYTLHPSLNPCGTHTLRWSCNNPNEQNISKKGLLVNCPACKGLRISPSGDDCKRCWDKDLKESTGKTPLNVRYAFGPPPGYEWWSMDYQNLELRIPAYKAPEPAMIELFERPDDPPYFGSNHLLVAHILHTDLFEECVNGDGELDGRIFKKKYADTWYSWTKNGNFAVQYGAQESSGTADRAYHVPGAQARIMEKFTGIKKLNTSCIRFAERHKYIETFPDRTVDPDRGYPLYCTETEWGKILPTVPLSYKVQGTAMWLTNGAMIRCQNQLDEWRDESGFDGSIAMQVHDEMVFQFPKGKGKEPWKTNLGRARKLRHLMAVGGDYLGIPTPVSMEYHVENWSEGRSV